MYTPSLSILSLLKDFAGKVPFEFLVSRTGIKRTDLEKSLEDLENEGVVSREDGTICFAKQRGRKSE